MSAQRYILDLRQQSQHTLQTPALPATVEVTPHRVVGLLLQLTETLSEAERTALNQVALCRFDASSVHSLELESLTSSLT